MNAETPQAQSQPAPPPPPPLTPEARLAALRSDFENSQKQVDTDTKARDALKAEIDALSPVVDDAKKILADYTSAYPGLDGDEQAIGAYDQLKLGIVKSKLSQPRMDQIDRVLVQAYDGKLGDQKKKVDGLKTGATNAKRDSNAARSDYGAALDAYNAFKGILKSLKDKSAAAKKLMTDIDAYEVKKNYDAMYVELTGCLEPQANDLHDSLDTVDQFRKNLYQAVIKLDDAWHVAQTKKDLFDAASASFAAEQTRLDAALANRTAELLKQVAALPPPPPSPAPPPPAPPHHTQPPTKPVAASEWPAAKTERFS
jgi:hypothetical protein